MSPWHGDHLIIQHTYLPTDRLYSHLDSESSPISQCTFLQAKNGLIKVSLYADVQPPDTCTEESCPVSYLEFCHELFNADLDFKVNMKQAVLIFLLYFMYLQRVYCDTDELVHDLLRRVDALEKQGNSFLESSMVFPLS